MHRRRVETSPFAIEIEQFSDVQIGNDISQRRDSLSEDSRRGKRGMRGRSRCKITWSYGKAKKEPDKRKRGANPQRLMGGRGD